MKRSPMPKSTKPMKRSLPKSSPIRASARNEQCTLQIPGVCNRDPATTVWAHSNCAEHGKAVGMKFDDRFGAYACYACHMVYDRQHPRPAGMTKEDVDARFFAGMVRSRSILEMKGLIK